MVLCLAWVWVWEGRVKAQGSAAFMPRLSGLCWIIKVTQPVAKTWTRDFDSKHSPDFVHVPGAPSFRAAEKAPGS